MDPMTPQRRSVRLEQLQELSGPERGDPATSSRASTAVSVRSIQRDLLVARETEEPCAELGEGPRPLLLAVEERLSPMRLTLQEGASAAARHGACFCVTATRRRPSRQAR